MDSSDSELHRELNKHEREAKFKHVISSLRSLQRACAVLHAASDRELGPSARLEKQHVLASFDRTLDRIANELEAATETFNQEKGGQ